MADPNLRVRSATDDYAVATLGNFLLLHWRRRVCMEGMHALGGAMTALSQTTKDGRFAFLTTGDLHCDVRTPPETRELLSAHLKTFDRQILAAAIVFEGHGFRATAVRSAVTAANILSRNSFPNRVFNKKPAAVAWLAAYHGLGNLSEQHLLDAVDQLQTDYDSVDR